MAELCRLEGLNPVTDRLIDDYRCARAPQALLLSGAKGIGKEELALYLAGLLLCQSPDRPCGQCTDCQRLKRGTHANLLRLGLGAKDRSIKIDALRGLLEALSLHPLESSRRVVLIHEVDALTVQAQNALLKSLEEPVAGDYFLLTTRNEAAVLPTILSRCRLVRLLPWPLHKVRDYLVAEGLAPDRAELLSRLSGGLPGAALSLNDNETYWETRKLVGEQMLSMDQLHKIPEAAAALKDSRDRADLVLDLVEQAAQRALHPGQGPEEPAEAPWRKAGPMALKRVMQAVFDARRYRASNVSWQAILDRLLFTIAKEIYSCQWS